MDQVNIVWPCSPSALLLVPCSCLYPCHKLSCLFLPLTERLIGLHHCSLCRLNHRPRRVSEKCKTLLEEPPAKAFASRMSGSRELHHLRPGGQFVSKVCPPWGGRSLTWILTDIEFRFNWAARKLHKRLEQLGAKEVYPRGEADEQHSEGLVLQQQFPSIRRRGNLQKHPVCVN
jgi:hypothetical protein